MRILSLILVVAVACATNPDPRRRSVAAAERTGYGGWIVVTMRDHAKVEGELIAIDPAYIYILAFLPAGPSLVNVQTESIEDAELFAYEREGGFGAWGIIGGLSTVSHGFFAVFTLPVWIISSGLASALESRSVIATLSDAGMPGLAKWARFPQGIPPGLDERALLVPHTRLPVGPPGAMPGTPPPPTKSDEARRRQAEAWTLTKQAADAARADDCTTALELAAKIHGLDPDFHATVTTRDVAIRRCLDA
ncbi:MAG: hypothetical protein ABI867_45465, partial [Kofleriaceae bacterium]